MNAEKEYRRLLDRGFLKSSDGMSDAEIERDRGSIPIPDALRMAYRQAARSPILHLHNRLYLPAALSTDADGFVEFAEENQNVVVWAFKWGDPGMDPAVYQKHWNEESYGPWVMEDQALGPFLVSFAYWNLANGAAPVSGVGEISEASESRIDSFPVIWRAPDFVVRGTDALFIASDDGDFYGFGIEEGTVSALAEDLHLDWFDMG